MKCVVRGAVALVTIGLCAGNGADQPTQLFGNYVWHQYYQDMLVDGVVVNQGKIKDLERRYQCIKKAVSRYKRPITVLDIGAAQGYYSFRLAHDFPDATIVMIEEDPYLQRICQLNSKLTNIVFLQKRISIDELIRLGECEHFDVVLALQVIHWSLDKWRETTDAIAALGDTILIETPPANDTGAIGAPYLAAIEAYCTGLGATIVGQFPRHTNPDLLSNLYLIQQKKKHILRAHWYAPAGKKVYDIKSNTKEKTITKKVKAGKQKYTSVSHWIAGINLLTFKALNGVYPAHDTLAKSLHHWQSAGRGYKEPLYENILIQGNQLAPVPSSGEIQSENTNYSNAVTVVEGVWNTTYVQEEE